MKRVAFLGLGAIGAPMAGHLLRDGIDLIVWNRTVDRPHGLSARGAAIAATASEAVRGRDVVITCFPTSSDLEELLNGQGVASALEAGSVLVDCTSGDPATSRRIAEQLAARDVFFLDAPVSGGVSGAEQGKLTVMVGGDPAVLERVRGVLESFAARIVHCGETGAGDAVKAINNALLAMHIWSTAEGLAALGKAGVKADVALEVINSSSGRSNTSMNLFPERVVSRAFPRTFRLALLDKDAGIAAQFARDQRVFSPLLQLTSELFRQAHIELGEEADHVEAVRVVEKYAGHEIG